MDIKNKIALVTGGANGIGYAVVEELLRNGVRHVAILDLIGSKGEEAVAKLNAEFGKDRALFIPCDVTKPQELEASFQKTVDTFKGLDIVINNAGIYNDLQWELMINVNVNGVVRGTLLGLKYMGKNTGGEGGVIVNVASIMGLGAYGFGPIYAATKHAVVGLTRSLADPYHNEKTGVRVLTICPGFTDTVMVDECFSKMLDIVDLDYVQSAIVEKYPRQRIENVAHGLVYIIKSAKNGSVWVTENNEPIYEVKIPEHADIKVPRED